MAGLLAALNAVIAGIILFILAFREGYKSAEYSHKNTLIPFIITIIVHFVISIALSFTPVVAGGVRYAAGLMSLGGDFEAGDGVDDIGYGACIAAYLVFAAVYAMAVNLAYYAGCKKRLADRAELTGRQSGENPEG
jgi:purine-cytosine permease-like protein